MPKAYGKVTINKLWRIYFKPSLGGLVVPRIKFVNRKSPKVINIMDKFAKAKPGEIARKLCEKYGGIDPETGKCRISAFRRYLRAVVEHLVFGKKTEYDADIDALAGAK